MEPIYIIDLISFDGYCATNACTKAQTLKRAIRTARRKFSQWSGYPDVAKWRACKLYNEETLAEGGI